MTRADIDPQRGAAGILQQIRELGGALVRAHRVTRVGFGFGGPVDTSQGRVIKSHQVQGWENFHLGSWCRENLGVPAILGNDCDVATLAEAHFGAGQGRRSVFFLTVGTGVGGGFVHDGQLLGSRSAGRLRNRAFAARVCTRCSRIRRSSHWPAAGASRPPHKPDSPAK